MTSFNFISLVLVSWDKFLLCHTSIIPIFSFPGLDRNLDCGLLDHVIMGFASVGMRARLREHVISFQKIYFPNVSLSFWYSCQSSSSVSAAY